MKQVKVFPLILLFILLIGNSQLSYAYPKAEQHDKKLIEVLFEPGYSIYQSNSIKNNVKAIKYASYLTIDQFGEDGEQKFNELKDLKIKGLPFRFNDIKYDVAILDETKKISASNHRLYTHQGWDRIYENKQIKKFWNTRRSVLLATVNTILDFNAFSSVTGYNDQCNSLCGIIYYVHILGDYDEADSYKKISLLPDLAGHSGTDKNDIITQLKGYISILFKNQEKSDHYVNLMKDLDKIEKDASKLVRSTGGVNTDEEFREYHQYAVDLLNLLIKHIPHLLKNEDFFAKVFYT